MSYCPPLERFGAALHPKNAYLFALTSYFKKSQIIVVDKSVRKGYATADYAEIPAPQLQYSSNGELISFRNQPGNQPYDACKIRY